MKNAELLQYISAGKIT